VLARWEKEPPIGNSILRSLSSLDLDLIRPFLVPIKLNERSILQEPNKPVEYVNFVETGIISMMTLAGGSFLETATVGFRGFAPVSVVLGAAASAHRSVVLVSGSALRIRADDLGRVMRERPSIRERLLLYVQSIMIHGSQTALCGVRHQLEQRLSCWLCLASDALDSNVIKITHDRLSDITGLRRAGITQALTRLEGRGVVRKMRGSLQIEDRKLLEKQACSCYKIIADAHLRTKSTCSAFDKIILPSKDEATHFV
jgi:CRP-like cAMP-binding protein